MAVPDFQSLMLPLLRLASDGSEHTLADAIDQLAAEFQLSEADRRELLPSGRQPRLNNRVGWASTYLRKAGLLKTIRRGSFQITERGTEVLKTNPTTINLNTLYQISADIAQFRGTQQNARASYDEDTGAWSLRPEMATRLRQKIEESIPDEEIRGVALNLLGFAIDVADQERSDAWLIRETLSGLRLMTGRLLACEISRSIAKIGMIGPVPDNLRLAADTDADTEVRSMPGGVILSLPVDRIGSATETIKEGMTEYIGAAMARVRQAPDLADHVPEAVDCIAQILGRELPQPEPISDADEEASQSDDGPTSQEPYVRGRTQIFERGERTITSLMSDIERGVIALPDLQRPFVWEDTKVRDLLDSLFIGFPVGTLVLWLTANEREARTVGSTDPALRATALVIDGQQRLTSLFAVMRGKEILGKDRRRRRITIAFRPRDGQFEVADAAIRRNPEFLPDVTELWNGTRPSSQIRRDLLDEIRDRGRAVDQAYEDAVERNLEIARAIEGYRFPTIDIREAANDEAAEEDVSEIFVRINNQGKRLGQADFVLTLLSVFHDELRDRIEDRAHEMSKDSGVPVDAQQLLRAACGVAFDRARMSSVYKYLRGVDPITGATDIAARQKMLAKLDSAAKACMEPTSWRDYLLRVRHAGFVSLSLIASKAAIFNAYSFYVRGLIIGVPRNELGEFVARWIFGTLLTARYSGASETAFEQDIGRVANSPAEKFVAILDEAINETITGDYWTRSLVSALATQSTRAPAALAFRAAQVVLGARALFSDQLLRELLDPPTGGSRSAGESHHLFPVAWLQSNRIRDRRRQNQVAISPTWVGMIIA